MFGLTVWTVSVHGNFEFVVMIQFTLAGHVVAEAAHLREATKLKGKQKDLEGKIFLSRPYP